MAELFADVMLAKLARWLRLAGIPVTDAPYTDDLELLESVGRARGTLLTSDRALFARAKKRKVKAVLVRQDSIEKELALVASSLRLKINKEPGSLCPICNSKLTKADKKEIAGLIPEDAYRRHRLFYFCRSCKKAYWNGTHWNKIKARLSKARRLARLQRAIR